MQMPPDIREQFRRHGRVGGLTRAARMSPERRQAVARQAAASRWIGERFGVASFEELGLPGGKTVDSGLADLASGRVSPESLLVSLAASRLRREGVPVGPTHDQPEERLYRLLEEQHGDLAHTRYSALLRQLVSFANACHLFRRGGARRNQEQDAP